MKPLSCLVLLLFVSSVLFIHAQPLELEYKNANEKYSKQYEMLKNEKGRGWKQFKRWQSFWKPRLLGKRIDTKQSTNEVRSYGKSWASLGPSIVPINKLTYPSSGLGRINIIKPDPNNLNNLWLGSASGGLWKSESRGAIWRYVEIPDMIYPGIGDIAIPKNNSNMIFIASGDANGYFMQGAISSGIYYSVNKGNNWQKSEIDFSPEKQGIINSIVCNDDASVIMIASSFGIYKSLDTCKTWHKVFDKYTRHLIKDIKDNNVYYGAKYISHGGSSFIKSTDSGQTWNELRKFDNASRIRIAQSESHPDRLYLVAVNANNNGLEGFYVSRDYGSTWIKKEGIPNLLGRNVDGDDIGGQGHYDLAITVHPTNPDIVYVGGIHVWMSSDAGVNWDIKNYWIGKYDKPYMHADQHDLVFIDSVLFSANDGGVYSSDDLGENWRDRSMGLNISQIYKLFVAKNYDNLIICGSQDNGAYHSDRWNNWFHILGGDATYAELDPESFSTWYIMSNNGVLNKSTDFGKIFKVIATPNELGETADWVTPFQINPKNSNSLYIGYNNLWKTEDQGWTYEKVADLNTDKKINLIEISKADTNIVYYSNYTNLYKYNASDNSNTILIENSDYAISAILSDSINSDRYYISYSGFNDTLKVVEFRDDARINISEGLPNFPVNDLLVYKGKIDFLFAATDVGVFFRNEYEKEWFRLGIEYPKTIITDLDIDLTNNRLIAATFGMGVWAYELPDCSIDDLSVKGSENNVLCPNSFLEISSNREDVDIIWSDGTKGDKLIVSEPGKYFYIARTDDLCYGFSDTLDVISSYLPKEIEIDTSEDSLHTLEGYSYTWFYNDTIISNYDHYSLKKGKKGYYKVVVSDTLGCEVESEEYYLPTAVRDAKYNDKISISPNPVIDFLYLSVDSILEIEGIKIYNNAGRLVKSVAYNSKISMQNMPSGVYVIELIGSKEVITYRVIKQ